MADAKLTVPIITGHHKHGFVSYAMRVNGYKMTTLRFFGRFDVTLNKSTQGKGFYAIAFIFGPV